MYSKTILGLGAAFSTVSATVYQGFNYASSTDFQADFAMAKKLAGTNGAFASARLYTMIEPNTANTPTSAIPAAISNDITLLLGLWASAGDAAFNDELAALTAAIKNYGSDFTSRVAAISVGSEDLYRISPTGIENESGVGVGPDTIVDYISQVRAAIKNTPLASALVGHVDTWNVWINGSNSAVATACDFVGLDAYPYFQITESNGIDQGEDLFFSAYNQTAASVGGKPVWVTETGWPTSGKTENEAVPSMANAKTYWDQVGCKLFGNVNTYWYTLDDSGATPSFGLTTSGTTPLYDLTCKDTSSSKGSTGTGNSATSSSSSKAFTSTAKSATSSTYVPKTLTSGSLFPGSVVALGSSSTIKTTSAASSESTSSSASSSAAPSSETTSSGTSTTTSPGTSTAAAASSATTSPGTSGATTVALSLGGFSAVLLAVLAAL